MIKVFGQTDTTFTSNGDIVVTPFKAKVHKEDNGDYYLDLECGLEYLDYITQGRIVVANTPQGEQAFRIGNVTKTGSKISVRCWHVFYDTLYHYFLWIYATELNTMPVNTFLAALNVSSALYPSSEFTVNSDITTELTYNYENKTYYDVLMDLISRTGGHLVRDNFSFELNEDIGDDNGIVIRYGTNLKDISVVENWDNVCTCLYAIGKDGVKQSPIYSETQYYKPFTKVVTFAQDGYERDNYQSDQAYKSALAVNLAFQASQYLAKHTVPEITYTLKTHIDFEADIGDTIKVIDERLNLSFLTRVQSYAYDCIAERYVDITFGTYLKSAKGMGKRMDLLTDRLHLGIVDNKQLVFNGDNTVSWSSV